MEVNIHSDATDYYTEPIPFQQVLFNILLNAKQAIENSGKIIIDAVLDEGGLKLKITDNGIGISEDILDKIFNPLFTTKDEGDRSWTWDLQTNYL